MEETGSPSGNHSLLGTLRLILSKLWRISRGWAERVQGSLEWWETRRSL